MTMAYFGGDPWVNQTAFGGTGDGTLFYPGTTAKIGGKTEIPVESLRLKGIRDGMEDYELLALAKKLGMGDQAKAIATGLFPKTYQATASAAAVDSARAELAALILHALGKDTAATTTAGGSGSTGTGTTACDTTACGSTTTSQPQTANASLGLPQGGGCSSGGFQSLWMAIPGFLLWIVQRRRLARA
jgi:hypothetical protein